MSTTEDYEGDAAEGPRRADDDPQYRLVYDYDNPGSVKQFTLYDEDREDARWLSCDAADAVDLDGMR